MAEGNKDRIATGKRMHMSRETTPTCIKKSPRLQTNVSATVVFKHFYASRMAHAFLWLGTGLISCGTEAIGVDACLKIERARCSAADACGLSERLACERYVDVQCLHGFVKSAQPTEKQTQQCADALGQLAECVADKGRKVSANTCKLELNQTASAPACEFVESPYDLRACRFLTPPDDDGDEEGNEDEDNQDDPNDEEEMLLSDASAASDAGPADGQ